MMEYVTRNGIRLARTRGVSPQTFWLKQNDTKSSEWARLAKAGHDVHHLMWNRNGIASGFAGSVRIDGIVYSYDEARRKFINV